MGKIGTSLVVWWLRIHLPMLPVWAPRVPVLVCALSSHCGQLPRCTETAELIGHSERAHVLQLRPKQPEKTNKLKAKKERKKERKRAKYTNQGFTEEDIQMAKKYIYKSM